MSRDAEAHENNHQNNHQNNDENSHENDREGGPHRRGRGRSRSEFRGARRGHRDGMRRPHRARRGDVRAAILSLLGQEPHNGYRLMQSFEQATDGAWRPSPGSIYPTLAQLQEEGLISATGEGRSSEFELTETGHTYILEHADELEQAWKSASGQSDEDLAFHSSVTKLNGAIDQFRIASTDEQRAAGITAIDEARRALYLILAE